MTPFYDPLKLELLLKPFSMMELIARPELIVRTRGRLNLCLVSSSFILDDVPFFVYDRGNEL